MPRLPKWLLLKEWLTFEDVIKVNESAPSELENILSKDHSEEFCRSYKFICSFCPRECSQEFREYRFETTARRSMRSHLKDHIKILKTKATGDLTEFLTKNQLYQQGKGQKHKLAAGQCEVPAKAAKLSKVTPSVSGISSLTTAASKKRSKTKRFTKLKNEFSDENKNENSQPTEAVAETKVAMSPKYIEEVSNSSMLDVELKHDIKKENQAEVQNNVRNGDDKEEGMVSSETQTEHGSKELETAQYKIATRLFAVDRSQWSNIEQVLEEIIQREHAVDEITDGDRQKILEGMAQWIESVKIYDQQTVSKLQDPLTPAEEAILNSMTPEDWRKLDTSHDPESKLRLTVYARLLLRDYEWFPRKLKPKVCRHCQRHYTASTSLYSHLVSLSGIRFWVCSKCTVGNGSKEEATFTRKHSLQYHILKEVGIPRYRCSQPGCNKTHNHTHHQKSHARQHTGEKNYICDINNCTGQFSNRNTYSRHLLQFHSYELTRANKLREIDEREAQLKVFAARLKARERSKCKRQRFDGTELEEESGKQTVEQRALTRLLCNNKQVETKTKTDAPNTGLPGIEKFMRPSASQLLCGIARDVRNTTSTIEAPGKQASSESQLGGLNLLATVSKYMNVENCDEEGSASLDGQSGVSQVDTDPGSHTKLFEALDISQSSLRGSADSLSVSKKASIPVISSLGAGVKKSRSNKPQMSVKPSISSATVIAKPSMLLPIPSGQQKIKAGTTPESTESTKLPNVIQDLKKRLMNAPKYGVPQQLVTPKIIKTTPPPVQTEVPVTQQSQKSVPAKKIIVNMSQVQSMTRPTIATDSVKSFSTITTLTTDMAPTYNGNTVDQMTVTSQGVNSTSNSTAVPYSRLTGRSGKTYLVLASMTNTAMTTSISSYPLELNDTGKTVPFSQL